MKTSGRKMVVPRAVDNRWIRRYRSFFFIGLLIFAFQVYLAFRFFGLNSENHRPNAFNPYKSVHVDVDAEVSVNSARRSKDTFVLDDEDLPPSQVKKAPPVGNNIKAAAPVLNRLRIEELDFVPACEIVTKEAISAIHRAKTQKCKQEISNVTCLIQKGMLYPKQLPNYCPNNDLEAGKALGCFKDEKNYRVLNGYYGRNKEHNSPEYCIRLCLQSGFPYAGVQYSTECFCGNEEPPSTAKLPDSSCNMKCPSNPHLACGGYFTINVYQTGIKKFTAQIANVPSVTPSTKTKPAKIVFLLTLNGRALRQVKRLIKILYSRNNYFYIHVDVRQDYLFRELLVLEKQFNNIRLTRTRFATIWGGASLLNMLLSVMQELLDITDWQWDFVLNLSESDYPVKPVNKLIEFLTVNRDRNFVKSHGREVQRFIQKQGLDKTFVECDTHMWRTGDRELPWGVQIDGGSDWVALSRTFVRYVAAQQPDELVAGLLVLFKYTLLPAESFFHTVLRNSRFCNKYVDNNLHVTNWKRKLGCKCQYKHVVDWCGCSPNDFKPDDWLRIQNTESRQLYFARKFEPIINQAVVLQLEQWLFGKSTATVRNLNAYWQSVYNHLDLGPMVDDSLLTISDSVVRLKLKKLNCGASTSAVHINEIHSYHLNDSYRKTLVTFDISGAHFEVSFQPKSSLVLMKAHDFGYRIKSLDVASDYDQKEQLSRNFVKALGPYSEPVLTYVFSSHTDSNKSTNVTFLWTDPAGRLVEVNEIHIDDSYVNSYIKPSFKQPLLPGAWTIKLIYKHAILAELKFLVTPLSYLSGNPIVHNQVNFVHSGSEIFKEFDSVWERFLPNGPERQTLEMLTVANAKRFGLDLQEWIDSLLVKFYKIDALCAVYGHANSLCDVKLPRCKDTDWSSFAPDPKSALDASAINQTTGMFDFW